MSFWETTFGDVTGSEKDAFFQSFEKIPNDTTALGCIKDIYIESDLMHALNKIKIEWQITSDAYKGQTVNQSLYVFELDSNAKDEMAAQRKRFRNLNMFKRLYDLCGLKPAHDNRPDNDDLKVFTGKILGIKVKETTPNSEGVTYNYVSEIYAPHGFECKPGKHLGVKNHNRPKNIAPVIDVSENIDILF